MYKDMVKKGVIFAATGLGAILTANGIMTLEQWNSVMTPGVVEGVAGVGSAVVSALVWKVSQKLMGLWG